MKDLLAAARMSKSVAGRGLEIRDFASLQNVNRIEVAIVVELNKLLLNFKQRSFFFQLMRPSLGLEATFHAARSRKI